MAEATADRVSSLISDIAARVEVARAKVNLALHVLGRRSDGYHLLDSLIVFAQAGDTLTAEPLETQQVELSIEGQFAGDLTRTTAPEDNLALRAAKALTAANPGRPISGIRLKLAKRLPIAAGLGGGSADAAATLRLLDRVWGWQTGRARLTEIGLPLGADVPACLLSRPLKAEGIGEKVTAAKGIPALPLVLLNPGVSVPTKNVFRRLASAERPAIWPLPGRFTTIIELVQWLRLTRNDLTEAAVAEAPVIARAVKHLASDQDCLLARMSGSGATVFGIFNTEAAAKRAASRIGAAHPTWWVAMTSTDAS